MYNGNGSTSGGGRRFAIPVGYLYAGIAVAVIAVLWLIASFFRAGIEGYYTLAAGILLLIGNIRLLLGHGYGDASSTSLLNSMIGGGLVFFFLGRGEFPPLGPFWYVPALLMLVIAAPLIIGRASVYQRYITMAQENFNNLRRGVGSRVKMP